MDSTDDSAAAPDATPADAPAGIDTAATVALVRARLFEGDAEPYRIGRYVILGRLGAGGMGVVYAGFDGELDRRVAIKVLLGDGTDEGTSRRLVREAQAMARLNHPNVAQVFEIGRHADRTFVAMEYVRGETLRSWAREKSWRAILDKYVEAGRGLAAAHGAGVIHRDFKPDNVLVGDDGRARVLDFGLARFREHAARVDTSPVDRTDDATLTHDGAVLGTPAYMAPEQISGDVADAPADQFAFCIALWEALFGARPFAGKNVLEIHAAIRDGRISAPSGGSAPPWVVAPLRRGLAWAAADRHPDMHALLRELTNDPSTRRRRWIALGVLAAAGVGVVAARQFFAASQAAACARAGAAVDVVWNDTARGRAREGLVASGATYGASTYDLLAPWLDRYAETWRDATTTACTRTANDAWRDGHGVAAEACLADGLGAFETLVAAVAEADVATVQRAVETAALLPRPAECIDERVLDRAPDPPTDAATRTAVAEVQRQLAIASAEQRLGRYDEAVAIAERALAAAEELSWPPLVARAHHRLGAALGRTENVARAETELIAAVRIAGGIGDDALAADASIHLIAAVGYFGARPEEGRRWDFVAQMMLTRLGGDDEYREADRHGQLGLLELGVAPDEAERQLLAAVELCERLHGSQHPEVARHLSNLGEAQLRLGTFDRAWASYSRAHEITEATLGPEHPDNGYVLTGLGFVRAANGRLDDALELQQRAWRLREHTLGPDHPDVGASHVNVADVLSALGDVGAAREHLQEALAIAEKHFPRDHPTIALTLNNLGNLERMAGDPPAARAHLERALAMQERWPDAEPLELARTLGNLGTVAESQGDLAFAHEVLTRALAIGEQKVGPENPIVAQALNNLADVERGLGALDDARAHYERSVQIVETVHGPQHPDLAYPLTGLGLLHEAAGDSGAAVVAFERALALREASMSGESPLVGESLASLAGALAHRGDHERARTLFTRALAILERAHGEGHSSLVRTLAESAKNDLALGNAEEGRERLERAQRLALELHRTGRMTQGELEEIRAAQRSPAKHAP